MTHALLQILTLQGVEHIHEVATRRSLAYWVFIRKIGLEDRVLLEHRVDITNTQLVVGRHLHVADILFLEELLLAGQHLLEEILVDYRFIWKIVLEAEEKRK